MRIRITFILIILTVVSCVLAQSPRTHVVLLGTGTPNADPERFGPSVAVVVDETPYIIDCGPGVVRRARLILTRVLSSQLPPWVLGKGLILTF